MNSTDDAVAAMKAAREAWIDAKRRLDSDKVWSGAEWHYNPCPPFKYRAVVKIAEEQIAILDAAIKAQEDGPLNVYIQNVPDKCDRIIWRDRYYHLHEKAQPSLEPARFTGAHTISTGAEYPIETIKRQMGEPASEPQGAQISDDEIEETVQRGMRLAWQLGQTYWQQADSESVKQNKLARETVRKFENLLEETVARALLRELAPKEGA